MKTAKTLSSIVALFSLVMFGSSAAATVFTVDCDSSQTINSVLTKAKDGDTIRVSGTCHETLSITRSGLTLAGVGGPIIDGGGSTGAVITVSGAQRVSIKGLTVQNGGYGILIGGMAGAALQKVRAQNNSSANIQVGGSGSAMLTDCTMINGAGIGLYVLANSSVGLAGTTIASNNSVFGILLAMSSSMGAGPGGKLQVNGNGNNGILIGNTSSAVFNGIAVTTNRNGGWGTQVDGNSSLQVQGTGSLLAFANKKDGIGIFNGGSLTVIDGSVQAKSNVKKGMNLYSMGKLLTFGSGHITVQENPEGGIYVYDGSNVRMENGGSTITGNGSFDILLGFGSKALLKGNTTGTIFCDGTQLLGGDRNCTSM
jgi:hypothetical protein